MIRVKYNAIIDKLKELSIIDSETITFVTSSKVICNACSLDPINQVSTDPSCPKCHGTGFVVTERHTDIIANVDYASALESEFAIGGKLKKGQVLLTINIDELSSKGFNPEDFLSCDLDLVDYIVIDKNKYVIDSVVPNKLQGIVYELELCASIEPWVG